MKPTQPFRPAQPLSKTLRNLSNFASASLLSFALLTTPLGGGQELMRTDPRARASPSTFVLGSSTPRAVDRLAAFERQMPISIARSSDPAFSSQSLSSQSPLSESRMESDDPSNHSTSLSTPLSVPSPTSISISSPTSSSTPIAVPSPTPHSASISSPSCLVSPTISTPVSPAVSTPVSTVKSSYRSRRHRYTHIRRGRLRRRTPSNRHRWRIYLRRCREWLYYKQLGRVSRRQKEQYGRMLAAYSLYHLRRTRIYDSEVARRPQARSATESAPRPAVAKIVQMPPAPVHQNGRKAA